MDKKTKFLPAGEFKQKCLAIMDAVANEGIEITITKRGKPVCRLIPLEKPQKILFGWMKGTVKIMGDITEPIGEKWDAQD